MKYSSLFSKIMLALLVPVFFGCATPAPPAPAPAPAPPPKPETIIVQTPPETLVPLTVGIMQRLFETNEQLINEIDRYQLILYGRIFLERNYTQQTNRLPQPGDRGIAIFENFNNRDEITIPDQTEGQAMSIEIVDNEIVLSVGFEKEPNCQLVFSALARDTGGYFYLKYNPSVRAANTGDERGVVQYGGPEYKLKFTGDRSPYLLIKLSQRDTDKINARTASGRKVL